MSAYSYTNWEEYRGYSLILAEGNNGPVILVCNKVNLPSDPARVKDETKGHVLEVLGSVDAAKDSVNRRVSRDRKADSLRQSQDDLDALGSRDTAEKAALSLAAAMMSNQSKRVLS